MLMACSVSHKKSPRRGRRAEPQSTDSKRQTRRKHASRTLERLDLSSCYFLKRSKVGISQNVKVLFVCVERSIQHDCSAMLVVESTAAFLFRCKRCESPNERLGTRPASTDKHYPPLAATARSALRCSCRNRSVRSLVQSKVTPESTANSR